MLQRFVFLGIALRVSGTPHEFNIMHVRIKPRRNLFGALFRMEALGACLKRQTCCFLNFVVFPYLAVFYGIIRRNNRSVMRILRRNEPARIAVKTGSPGIGPPGMESRGLLLSSCYSMWVIPEAVAVSRSISAFFCLAVSLPLSMDRYGIVIFSGH